MMSLRSVRWGLLLLVWLAFLLCTLGATAQVDTGTILGTVTDTTGASVVNARVTITNLATAAPLTATTKEDGRFEFTPLAIGTYSVVVEASGFKKATVQSVHLDIQQHAMINVVLQPGAVSENVEVT